MRRLWAFIFIVILGFVVNTLAQECGPGCPVCSGSGSSTGALLPKAHFVSTAMSIPNNKDETAVFNLRAGVTSWLDVGLGYTMKSDKLIWSVRCQPLSEDETSWRPGFIIGTGSVQTGKSDQSVFIQLTKAFDLGKELAARFSIGAASLLPEMDKGYLLAGITMTIQECWSPFISFDGLNLHFGLSWIPAERLFITGMLVETKFPAIMLGYRFGF